MLIKIFLKPLSQARSTRTLCGRLDSAWRGITWDQQSHIRSFIPHCIGDTSNMNISRFKVVHIFMNTSWTGRKTNTFSEAVYPAPRCVSLRRVASAGHAPAVHGVRRRVWVSWTCAFWTLKFKYFFREYEYAMNTVLPRYFGKSMQIHLWNSCCILVMLEPIWAYASFQISLKCYGKSLSKHHIFFIFKLYKMNFQLDQQTTSLKI